MRQNQKSLVLHVFVILAIISYYEVEVSWLQRHHCYTLTRYDQSDGNCSILVPHVASCHHHLDLHDDLLHPQLAPDHSSLKGDLVCYICSKGQIFLCLDQTLGSHVKCVLIYRSCSKFCHHHRW